MSEDVTFEFLEVRNIKPEYVDEVVRQHIRDGWQVVKETPEPGEELLEGQTAHTVLFKRRERAREVALHP
jgi:hypothetical protein